MQRKYRRKCRAYSVLEKDDEDMVESLALGDLGSDSGSQQGKGSEFLEQHGDNFWFFGG